MLVLKSDKMTLTIQCKKKVHVLHIKLMKLIHIWINTMFSQPKPILINEGYQNVNDIAQMAFENNCQ